MKWVYARGSSLVPMLAGIAVMGEFSWQVLGIVPEDTMPAPVAQPLDLADTTFIQTFIVLTRAQGEGTVGPSGGQFDAGNVVTPMATPASGSPFVSWSSGARGRQNQIEVTTTSHTFVTTNFVPQYTLTTLADGDGTVTPATGPVDAGTEVQVSATPDEGWRFVKWTGGLTGTTNSVTVTMDADKTVTAAFERDGALFLDVTIEGNGSVSKSPDQPTYAAGTVVTLTAVPGTDALFDQWNGDVRDSVFESSNDPNSYSVQLEMISG